MAEVGVWSVSPREAPSVLALQPLDIAPSENHRKSWGVWRKKPLGVPQSGDIPTGWKCICRERRKEAVDESRLNTGLCRVVSWPSWPQFLELRKSISF